MDQLPKVAADRMLGRLARWLRLCGIDVLTNPNLSGAQLLASARRENRVMLTRDKRLRTAPDVIFIENNDFRSQLKQVLAQLSIDPRQRVLTRCSRCNIELVVVPREVVVRRVPPFVYARHDKFGECERCGRIYWNETHSAKILNEIASLGVLPRSNQNGIA